jgi:Na+/melibiose symporter-like transporter
MYIDADVVIKAASLLTALGVIGGVVVWCVKFIGQQKKQDKELAAMCQQQTIMCFAILACLKGLREQGCNGPVSEALEKLEKHLNKQAHKWAEL